MNDLTKNDIESLLAGQTLLTETKMIAREKGLDVKEILEYMKVNYQNDPYKAVEEMAKEAQDVEETAPDKPEKIDKSNFDDQVDRALNHAQEKVETQSSVTKDNFFSKIDEVFDRGKE